MRNSMLSVLVISGLALAVGSFACAEANLPPEGLPVADAPRDPKPKPDAQAAPDPVVDLPTETESNSDAGSPEGRADGGDGGVDTGNGKKISCATTNKCATARKATIASLPGDVTLVPLELRGSTAEFVQLRITEDSSTWYDLKLKATLISPPGTNFDLVMYVPDTDTTNECTESYATKAVQGAGEDVARKTVTDSILGDDSRTVVFEIRHVSGDCSSAADARWVLKVQGNAE